MFDLVRGYDWPAASPGVRCRTGCANAGTGARPSSKRRSREEQERYLAAAEVGDVSSAVVWASEAVDLIRDLPPAAEIVERMVSEASAALERGPRPARDADR